MELEVLELDSVASIFLLVEVSTSDTFLELVLEQVLLDSPLQDFVAVGFVTGGLGYERRILRNTVVC